ncbi:MAG: hypothetical protein M1827_002615 [Pycnora praestabilis]|nr:MAG: hypothetical protein M1827_002615 [Pycnora praestabilis]
MSYSDDAVKSKLSSLNETQESIVTVSQWVMFHRRHADRTGQLWLQRLKDSGANKRLNLIYLANEVAQQSKARRKDDFLNAFSPVIAEATATAYRGATHEVQQKLRRVVEVWRQRQIFELPILEAVEARIDDLDKSRSSGKRSLGGSLFSSSAGPSVPPEIHPLISLQTSVSKTAGSSKIAIANANIEYDKLIDPANLVPTPPVHAARLSALLKSLASAEGAVAESIKSRQALIEGLEKLLDINRTSLAMEESEKYEVTSRKTSIEAKKREVEDGIMRGLSAESSPVTLGHGSPDVDLTSGGINASRDSASVERERPDVEELTPPPVESLTPMESPFPDHLPVITTTTGADIIHEQQPNHTEPAPAVPPPLVPAAAGSDLLSSLSMPFSRPQSGSPTNGSGTKKRKIDEEEDFTGFAGGDAMDGLDDDVAEMLRKDSGSFL